MCSTWHDLQFHLWCSGQQPNVSKHCLNLNFVTRTSLSVWVGVDFANQESVLVQQHSGGLQLIRQGLPAAAHPLHRSGGVGVTQAVPELRKRLPQLFLIPMRRKKNSSDSMVINTYVSCLISIANKHIIMHPVHLPHTQHRTWGPEISHTYTWVISLSAAGVLAQLLLFKTFTKHHLAGGNQSEQSFLQSFNWVFSSRRSRCAPVLLRTEVHSPWSKNTTGKEWHHLSCSCFEVKNRGIFTQRDSCSQRCRHITQRMLQNAEALKPPQKAKKA